MYLVGEDTVYEDIRRGTDLRYRLVQSLTKDTGTSWTYGPFDFHGTRLYSHPK